MGGGGASCRAHPSEALGFFSSGARGVGRLGLDVAPRSCWPRRSAARPMALAPSPCWSTDTPASLHLIVSAPGASSKYLPGVMAGTTITAVGCRPGAGSGRRRDLHARCARRRPLCERRQDVHHQRRARRPVLHRRAIEARARAPSPCSSSRRGTRASVGRAEQDRRAPIRRLVFETAGCRPKRTGRAQPRLLLDHGQLP